MYQKLVHLFSAVFDSSHLTSDVGIVFRAAEQARKSWKRYVSQENSIIVGKQQYLNILD